MENTKINSNRKRKFHSLEDKLKAIEFYNEWTEQNGCKKAKSAVARILNIDRYNLGDWLKSEEEIRNNFQTQDQKIRPMKVYHNDFKIEVMDYLHSLGNNLNIKQASLKFDVRPDYLKRWLENEETIRAQKPEVIEIEAEVVSKPPSKGMIFEKRRQEIRELKAQKAEYQFYINTT